MTTFAETCWAAYWARNSELWNVYVRDRKSGKRDDPAFKAFEAADCEAYRRAQAIIMSHVDEGYYGKTESAEEAEEARKRAEEKALAAVKAIAGTEAAAYFLPEGAVTIGSGHAEAQRQEVEREHEAANAAIKAERPLYYAAGYFARQVAHLEERARKEGYKPRTRKRLAKLKKLAFKFAREVDADPQSAKLGV